MLQLYSVYTDGVVHGFGKMWPYSHAFCVKAMKMIHSLVHIQAVSSNLKHGQGEKKSFIYEI